MRVLVTGGGGFLGSHIARRLHDRGDQVTVLGRGHYSHLGDGIQLIQADLRNRNEVFSACENQEVVFHAAAKAQIWGDPKEFYGINVEGTKNILDACIQHDVKKLIFTSSPSVVFNKHDMENIGEEAPYPESYLCEYPRTKALAERLVLGSNGVNGLLTVALRPHLIWGPKDPHLVPRIIERAKMGQLMRVGNGMNKVDLIYIDNAVEAHIQACEALEQGSPLAGKTYFVSDGEPVMLWSWINRLLEQLHLPPVKRSISYRTAYLLGAAMEGVYSLFQIKEEPRMTRFIAAQLATSHYFNISQAKRDFGYKPIVSPDEGMRRLIEYLQACPAS